MSLQKELADNPLFRNSQEFITDRQREQRFRVARQRVAEDYYRGVFYTAVNWSGFTEVDPQLLNANAAAPMFKYVIDGAAAAMGMTPYAPDVSVTAFTPTMKAAADVLLSAVNAIYEANGGTQLRRRLQHNVLMTGDAFLEAYFDPMMEDTVLMTYDELLAFMEQAPDFPIRGVSQFDGTRVLVQGRWGGVRIRFIPPGRVLVPAGVDHFDNAPYFSVTYYMPIGEARELVEKVGGDPADMQPDNIGNTLTAAGASQQGSFGTMVNAMNDPDGTALTARANVCALTLYWHRQPDGRYTVIYLAGVPASRPVAIQEGIPEHFITHVPSWQQPGFFWSSPFSLQLTKHQRQLNIVRTLRFSDFIESPKRFMLTPVGSEIVALNNDIGMPQVNFMQSSAGGSPQVVEVSFSGTAEWCRTEERIIIEQMMMLGRLSDLQRGSIPDRISQGALTAAAEITSSSLEVVNDCVMNGLGQCLQKAVNLITRDPNPALSYPRVSLGSSGYGGWGAAKWSSAEMSAGLRVKMKRGVPLPQSVRERIELAEKLFTSGILQSPQQVFDIAAGYVDPQFVPIEVRNNRMVATTEVDAMISGVVIATPQGVVYQDGMPLIQPAQDHAVHVTEHEVRLSDPGLTPELKQLLMAHIAEHREIIAEERKQAQLEATKEAVINSIATQAGQIAAAGADKATPAAMPQPAAVSS